MTPCENDQCNWAEWDSLVVQVRVFHGFQLSLLGDVSLRRIRTALVSHVRRSAGKRKMVKLMIDAASRLYRTAPVHLTLLSPVHKSSLTPLLANSQSSSSAANSSEAVRPFHLPSICSSLTDIDDDGRTDVNSANQLQNNPTVQVWPGNGLGNVAMPFLNRTQPLNLCVIVVTSLSAAELMFCAIGDAQICPRLANAFRCVMPSDTVSPRGDMGKLSYDAQVNSSSMPVGIASFTVSSLSPSKSFFGGLNDEDEFTDPATLIETTLPNMPVANRVYPSNAAVAMLCVR